MIKWERNWHKNPPPHGARVLVFCPQLEKVGEDDGVRFGRWRGEQGGFFVEREPIGTVVGAYAPYGTPARQGERRYLRELSPNMRIALDKLPLVGWFSREQVSADTRTLESLVRRQRLQRQGNKYRVV